MSVEPSSTSVTRSTDFWFDDGSIVLQVEETQLRIHRGVLCASSTAFSAMCEVSNPDNMDASTGCPVVVLHGDRISDWNDILKYMYFPARVSKNGEPLPFRMIGSLLRLGRKYAFSEIWALALHTLRAQLPSDVISEWDNYLNDTERFTSVEPPGKWLAGHEIELLNLALENDLQTILPIAYYLCAHHYTLAELLSGVPREGRPPSAVNPNALHTLLLGRQKLQSVYHMITMSWLTLPDQIPGDECECIYQESDDNWTTCETARIGAFETLVTLNMDLSVKALGPLEDDWFADFCETCNGEIIRMYEHKRNSVWVNLPSYFNLPAWGDLKDPEVA